MSDHLPECYFHEPSNLACICDRLRAAEQRVTAKWAQTRARNQRVQELIAEAFDNGCRSTEKNYTKGYADALDKAREAVDELAPKYLPTPYEYITTIRAALAAIDALRGES